MPQSSEDVAFRELTSASGRHPVRQLLVAAAAGAEITPGDLDRASETAKPGQAQTVRRALTEMVGQITQLKAQGRNQDARRIAKSAARSLADRVEPTAPPHGIFDDPDRGRTPAELAERISRH